MIVFEPGCPLVSETTTLSTVPQPLPHLSYNCLWKLAAWKWSSESGYTPTNFVPRVSAFCYLTYPCLIKFDKYIIYNSRLIITTGKLRLSIALKQRKNSLFWNCWNKFWRFFAHKVWSWSTLEIVLLLFLAFSRERERKKERTMLTEKERNI